MLLLTTLWLAMHSFAGLHPPDRDEISSNCHQLDTASSFAGTEDLHDGEPVLRIESMELAWIINYYWCNPNQHYICPAVCCTRAPGSNHVIALLFKLTLEDCETRDVVFAYNATWSLPMQRIKKVLEPFRSRLAHSKVSAVSLKSDGETEFHEVLSVDTF